MATPDRPPPGAPAGPRAPGPASPGPEDDEHPELSALNARAGLWLFGVYLLLYGGFMGLSAFAPRLIGAAPFGGVNLAILYGLGLILTAVVLALFYVALCRRAAGRRRAEGR